MFCGNYYLEDRYETRFFDGSNQTTAMKFDEVIGQEEVRDRLLQMTREGRLPHAIMLCGPQGVGKKALAIAFASYLLGEDNAMVRRLEHPDLHFTYPTIKLPSMSSDHKPVSDDFGTSLSCKGLTSPWTSG